VKINHIKGIKLFLPGKLAGRAKNAGSMIAAAAIAVLKSLTGFIFLDGCSLI
jgi:hypothetical protein